MKTALITGGVRRIGAAIAEDLAAHGFNLALHYISSEDEGGALSAKLQSHGIRCELFQADLANTNECRNLFDDAQNKFGRIDLLVNNASVFDHDSALKFDEAVWDDHMAIHIKAPSILADAMAQQEDLDRGLIVNMIDQRVWRLNPNFYSYTLSKSALWTATRTLAQTLAPRIRVNAIGPGPTLKNPRQDSADFRRQVEGLILKRGPELEEFGATVRYFWETPSVTGQMIMLDGGQHLAWETPDIADIVE